MAKASNSGSPGEVAEAGNDGMGRSGEVAGAGNSDRPWCLQQSHSTLVQCALAETPWGTFHC